MAVAVIVEHDAVQAPWADALVEVVREAMTPLGFVGYLGYHLWEPSAVSNPFDGWMLAVFPSPFELCGGSDDGARGVSGFRLDVLNIMRAFSQIDDVVWNAPLQYNGALDGPEVLIRGNVLGKRVLLRVYSLPPPGELPSHYVDPARGEAWVRPSEEGG